MTNIPIEKPSTLQNIWNFIKNLFKKTTKHKCACGSKCGNNCCCEGCILTIAYSEKESDHSEEDIYMTPNIIEVY